MFKGTSVIGNGGKGNKMMLQLKQWPIMGWRHSHGCLLTFWGEDECFYLGAKGNKAKKIQTQSCQLAEFNLCPSCHPLNTFKEPQVGGAAVNLGSDPDIHWECSAHELNCKWKGKYLKSGDHKDLSMGDNSRTSDGTRRTRSTSNWGMSGASWQRSTLKSKGKEPERVREPEPFQTPRKG